MNNVIKAKTKPLKANLMLVATCLHDIQQISRELFSFPFTWIYGNTKSILFHLSQFKTSQVDKKHQLV